MAPHSARIAILCTALAGLLAGQTPPDANLIRGDAKVEFSWRAGYHWYGDVPRSAFEQENAARSTPKWYDGHYRSKAYQSWDGRPVVGAHLDFDLSTPVSRGVRCTSDVVPISRAGRPVTFSIPIQYTIGTEPQLSAALKISGIEDDFLVFTFKPQREIIATTGRVKAVFYANAITPPAQVGTAITVTGMLHLRVYPQLVQYGGRMKFEFYSRVQGMDVSSRMTIGSLWEDVSQTDVRKAWIQSGLSDETFEQADRVHLERIDAWNRDVAAIAAAARRPGRVEISTSEAPRPYDRGEGRVQAYPGNPLKDIPYGPLNYRMTAMARTVSAQMSRRFSLFRYQLAEFLWRTDNPDLLNTEETPLFEQWMDAANQSSDEVMLNLGLAPFVKAYVEYTKKGALPLPEAGVPGYQWEKMQRGYVTALHHAKKVCPRLRIIQMPYEFDNLANTESHREAHYKLFRLVYLAVNEVNKTLPAGDRLQVAGLGVNNPSWGDRWNFIDSFLQRYASDRDPEKRLDFITWHTYAYSWRDYPSVPRGFNQKIRELLAKHRLPQDLPIIIDEMGLAEVTTIESLSDMNGALRKEAAMACYTAALDHWYREERGNFRANSGAGWHFSLLTYGMQNVLSPYAKGMVMRSRLPGGSVPSTATPRDERGYGLYSLAAKDDRKLYALVWAVSPGIFYNAIGPIHYPATEVFFKDLPPSWQSGTMKATIQSSEFDNPVVQPILSAEKFQTTPLSRGGDRYNLEFSPEEVTQLNAIPSRVIPVSPQGNRLTVPLDVREHGMYLITVER